MTKATITRLFIGGFVALVAGVILVIIAATGMFASGGFVIADHEVTAFTPNATTWTFIGLAGVSVFGIVGGAIAGLVAWIGALLNTVQLDDKTWFILLLVLGLLSFGWIAMILYVLAGPDGTVSLQIRSRQPASAGTHA